MIDHMFHPDMTDIEKEFLQFLDETDDYEINHHTWDTCAIGDS